MILIVCTGASNNRLPIQVPADGNCLFHALSVAGNTCLATELRVRVSIEMVKNKEKYVKKYGKTGINLASPDYVDAVVACVRLGS